MNAPVTVPTPKPVPPYKHTPLFPLGADKTPYRKITTDGVKVETVLGKEMLVVSREGLPDALVPFVHAIVPEVDLDGGRVVLTPPDGLLDEDA